MGILRKLKHRMVKATKLTALEEKKKHNKARIKKTNILLLSVAIMFGVSWLPLNIINIVVDIFNPIDGPEYRTVFAICHMIGMSSACSNPLLYGWLNDNFRKEFVDILSTCTPASFFIGRTFTIRTAHATNATGMDITEAEAAVLTAAAPISIHNNLNHAGKNNKVNITCASKNSNSSTGSKHSNNNNNNNNNNNSGSSSPNNNSVTSKGAIGGHTLAHSTINHHKSHSVTIVADDVVTVTTLPITDSVAVSSNPPRKVLLEVHSRS